MRDPPLTKLGTLWILAEGTFSSTGPVLAIVVLVFNSSFQSFVTFLCADALHRYMRARSERLLPNITALVFDCDQLECVSDWIEFTFFEKCPVNLYCVNEQNWMDGWMVVGQVHLSNHSTKK